MSRSIGSGCRRVGCLCCRPWKANPNGAESRPIRDRRALAEAVPALVVEVLFERDWELLYGYDDDWWDEDDWRDQRETRAAHNDAFRPTLGDVLRRAA